MTDNLMSIHPSLISQSNPLYAYLIPALKDGSDQNVATFINNLWPVRYDKAKPSQH